MNKISACLLVTIFTLSVAIAGMENSDGEGSYYSAGDQNNSGYERDESDEEFSELSDFDREEKKIINDFGSSWRVISSTAKEQVSQHHFVANHREKNKISISKQLSGRKRKRIKDNTVLDVNNVLPITVSQAILCQNTVDVDQLDSSAKKAKNESHPFIIKNIIDNSSKN